MKDERLKPCPFCGSTNQKLLTETDEYAYPHNKGHRAVVCECGARLYARTNAEAKEKWNERALEVVRCRECRFCYVNPILRTFRCHRFMAVVNANDFCIYAERRPEK